MTPEIWTILGTGFTLAALGVTGFTLLWRYITRAEQRIEARYTELKGDFKGDLSGLKGSLLTNLAAAEQRRADHFAHQQELADDVKALGIRMHTLEVQMAKLEGLLEGLREAIAGKRAA